jgi:hypothetical protein
MTRSLRVVVLLLCTLTIVSVLRASLPIVTTGQWTPAMDMADARDGASAVLLANGDTLIAGGSNPAGTLQTADIYQIDGSLTAAATMTTARSRHTATLLQDGRVLVAGGDSGGGTATNSAEIYDPGSGTWNSVGPLVSARFGHTATLLADGRVAIIGGENNGSPVAGIEVFDPNTDLFTQPASLNVARKGHAAAMLADGRVLVAGGFGVDAQNNQIALSSVEIFDPVTNAVSAAANLNTARGRHSATVVLDGLVVVAGGSNGQADLNSIEIYTPATDAWAVSAATLSVAREGHVATLLPKNNSVLVSGGSSNGTALQSAEIFRPWTGTVVSAGNLNATRVAGTGSPFGAEGLYLAAGGSGSKTTEFFRFATIKTDKVDYAPGTPVLMSGTGYQPNEVVGLNLKQDDGDADINVSVQADAAGNVSYQGFAPDPGDVGTHFHLTAVGQTSGFQAQTVFTDAQPVVISFTGNGSGTITGTGFNCTDTAGVASGTCSLNFNNNNVVSLTATSGGSIGAWATTGVTVTSGCTSGSTTCTLKMGTVAATVNLTIDKVSQTITFGALTGKIYGDADFTVSATASSGLAVSFSSQTTGVCTVSASTVHIVAAGSCTIRASQAGDANHLAAPNVDQSFTVAQKSITATLTANNKIYDATTAATQNTCTLSGVLPADTANVTCSAGTLSFADKNVGTAKVVSVSAISLSGAAAANYQLSSTTASASANITARPLTVTALTNTKIYDGGVAAAALPAITTGVLQGSDTAGFTETYDTKNAGTGKTLTPSGTVNDGNGGNNYAYTFVNNTTGTIAARALTITAAPNTKIYDGTTSAAALPTITTGALQGADTAGFVESYDTKHVGTGKTLTPSGTVNDGNSGNNYSYTFVNNSNGVISTRPITVTASTNNKVYDGTASAASAPAITTGTLAAGDTATLTESYDNKNAGTGKTLVPAATIKDAGSANVTSDYNLTFANDTTGIITPRAITVTAASDSKIYDATTTSAGVPTISAPGIAPGDTAAFVQTFDTKNAGTGKILTPSGSVTDGNSGHNYAVTFANNSAGIITPRPLTVTAAANTKIYDGTISAAATPAITTGALQGADTAGFTETYDTKNAGTGKTLTPSGTVSDGNSGNNYSYTFVNSSTGVISTRPITVTAAIDTKNYDGTTSSSAVPTVTSGSLATGDTGSFTQLFDSRNAGARTLTASGSVNDGNSGNNYAVTFATANGTINKRAISVTAASDAKIYDSTNSSSATPTVGAPGIASGDTAAFVQTFDNKNAGTGKTLTPFGTVNDGNGGNNYTVTFVPSATGVISARPITVTASANTKIYDGNTSAAASPAITTGTLQGPDTASFSETYDTKNAGSGKTLTPAGTVNDANGGNNYNVTFAAVSTGVVNKRSLTVSASADSKIYDGNANATAHLTDDRVTGDALAVAYGTAAFIDKNVGVAKTVNVSGITVTGADSGNYTFNSSATATANITPRDLTVTATADNKIYDRTTSAVAHLADNRISGDILTPSYTTAAFADRNVGNGKTVTVSGISISGVDAGNYNLTNSVTSALANITARTVTPVVAANNKVYDRLTTATLNSQSVSGFIPPDVVGLTVTVAAFDTKNAGSGKAVTATGLSLNGADAANYSLNGVNSATTTADILQRPLNVTAAGVDRIYDGTTAALVTLSDDRIAGDVLTESYATASFANKNVGNNKPVSVSGIAISGLDAGNYSLNNTTASTTANISPRSLTISATGVSKVYDGTTAATVTLADDRIAGDLLTDSYASASFADKNVANTKPVSVSGISISGIDAGNYTFNSTASTFANITPRPLHISAAGVSRVYDGTTVATVTLADDRVSGDVFSDSYTSASFADKNAANAKPVSVIGITISGPDAGNYSANTSAATTADITARPITVSATSDTKVYDATTSSSHTPSITTGSVAVGDLTAFTQAFDSKNAGARTLIASGSVNDGNGGNNYSISFATAAGSITQRPLTVTATATGKIYDGTTAASVTLSDNHLGGDSVSDSYASAAFSDKNVGTGKLVSVTGISLSGADSGNYNLTNSTASTTADIMARTLTVSAHGIDKPYDGGTTATVTLSDDPVSGDLVTDSYGAASFADKNVGPGKPVAVSGISINGADAANYALASTSATTSAAINARSLTVSAAGIGKIYDGTITGSVTLSDNRVAGDTFADSYVAASFSDRNAGTSKAIAVSGISISGPDAGNYSLANTTASANADISPLGVTIAAVTDSKVYNGTILSSGIPHVTPALVSGDSGIFSQTFNNKNVGNSKLLVPAATITDGNGGNNYAVTLVNNSTGVITPRGLAVSASASDKVYDGTTSASVSLTDNRLSGDSFSINFAAANFADQNAGIGKTVTVSGISLSGPDAGNYTPNTSAIATASILQRPVTVTADSKTRIYGTPDPALTYQITSGSLVSGDSFTGNLVRVSGSTVGSYAISQGTLALSSNYILNFIGSNFTITPAATTITLNPAATITLGQSTLPVSATVHAVLPSTAPVSEGFVTFTLLQGSTIVASATSATVSAGGASANLAVSTLPVGSYTVQATFNPPTVGANFTGSSSTTGVSAGVQYNICLLYDGTKSVKSGATYPVKIYLCDVNGRDVSASGIIIHAISASMLSGWSGPPEDAGNSNPDLDFRYDQTLGPSGGYIFNLKTTGLGSGTYSLNFSAAGDPASHSVPFGVK